MSDERRFDGIELIDWADKYGHPEDWAKKAQDLHAKNEQLAGELAQVKAERDGLEQERYDVRMKLAEVGAERDEWKALRDDALDAWSDAEAERDTAIRKRDDALESLRAIASLQVPAEANMAQHQACSIAVAFLAGLDDTAPVPVQQEPGRSHTEKLMLVGEGCPWATVDQMADDLFLLSKVIGPSDPHATVTAMRRGHEAAALLSSGSNP